MSFIQPKPYLDNFKLRHKAYGIERRRNMSKIILEHGTPFPIPVTYEDIDTAFFNWVDKDLDISYNGKRLPTYKLFSNQRLSEYSQTWENLDDSGSLVLNFKTITRENNPQHGESQGSNYNIPGNRDYPMFIVPTLQENGEEAYDLYSMKQPVSVNFQYTVSIITNKYELLNRFNEMMQTSFSSLETYISPNDHPMPMLLDSVNDESEYTIDDRKFYSQSYQIKLLGYIIMDKDYKVTRLPSRFITRFIDNNNDKLKKRTSVNDLPVSLHKKFTSLSNELAQCDVASNDAEDILHKRSSVVLKEDELPDNCCIEDDDNHFYNKSLQYNIEINNCNSGVTFTIDNDMILTEVETDNVYDFKIHINDELADINTSVRFYNGDSVRVNITRNNAFTDSLVQLKGYDPNSVVDDRINPESSLDDPNDTEIIDVKDKLNDKD